MLLNFVGELVIYQSIMSRHKLDETTSSDHALHTISFMGKLVNEIQDVAMGLRMTNVKSLFQRMQRAVRDISLAQGKEVVFSTDGEHVELDRTIIDRMSDPLTHLIRNAVDHGIEIASARKESGKSHGATIRLSAHQDNDMVLITVSDDGKGLDPAKLIAKAREKGIIGETAKLTDEEAYALIFKPGFSTKEQVTDISGRGVGMDVVARAVEDMKGSIKIQTTLGRGTAFVISLPLSLSIINGMVVGIGLRKYVIPVAQLVETLEYRKLKVETCTKDGRMINLRGEVIPVLSLEKLLGQPRENRSVAEIGNSRPGVVISSSGKKISFEVDELLGQQQVVIKKLGSKMENLPGVVGGAILSNGEPSLVLDLRDLSEQMSETSGRRHVA
jgi:two-component system chemotaxis sensor kinase CheA